MELFYNESIISYRWWYSLILLHHYTHCWIYWLLLCIMLFLRTCCCCHTRAGVIVYKPWQILVLSTRQCCRCFCVQSDVVLYKPLLLPKSCGCRAQTGIIAYKPLSTSLLCTMQFLVYPLCSKCCHMPSTFILPSSLLVYVIHTPDPGTSTWLGIQSASLLHRFYWY